MLIKIFETKRKVAKNCFSTTQRKDFRLVRLTSGTGGRSGAGLAELGVFVARVHLGPEIGCAGYFIAHVVPDGLIKR